MLTLVHGSGSIPEVSKIFYLFLRRKIMENRKHGEEYVCKRWRMLTWLMEKGYKPIRTIPDVKRTDYFNWVFTNTPEFEQDVELYFAQLKAKN